MFAAWLNVHSPTFDKLFSGILFTKIMSRQADFRVEQQLTRRSGEYANGTSWPPV
jgi:hypothetical protein